MPTVYALVSDNAHFLDAQGNPASGAKLFVYTAGSSTKATTYTESDGATANANPIVLNSRGEMPSGCYVASGTYKTVLAPSNDSDPPTSPYRTRDNLTPVNDTSTTVAQFTASGQTPTFVSTTQFTLVGDHRTEFHVGRRIKTANSAGTGYHTITAVAFSTNTTVTVANDSTALDSGLSSVDLSILRADDKSALPGAVVDEDDYTFAGNVTVSGNLSVTGTGTIPVGTVAPYLGTTAPSGWLLLNGDTIGSASSGATRASADNEALFTKLFDEFADAQSAILTSAGAGTTRAAQTDAATAWAANCRITLPDATGRAIFGKESSATRLTSGSAAGVDGATMGASGGAQEHALTKAQIPAHVHTTNSGSSNTFSTSGSTAALTVGTVNSGDGSADGLAGSAHTNLPPALVLSYIVKY